MSIKYNKNKLNYKPHKTGLHRIQNIYCCEVLTVLNVF